MGDFSLDKNRQRQKETAAYVLDKLTEVQRKRYLLHFGKGLTVREIAQMDGVSHQSIVESLAAAEKKIKKILKTN